MSDPGRTPLDGGGAGPAAPGPAEGGGAAGLAAAGPAAAAPAEGAEAAEGSAAVDISTRVGEVTLPNPVMTASGTAGHGAELGGYFDLSRLGAVVVKSLSTTPWAGNPAPRVHQAAGGMLNSVGLQNPGVGAWLEYDLPALAATGARVVASIWGFRASDYRDAAAEIAAAVRVAGEAGGAGEGWRGAGEGWRGAGRGWRGAGRGWRRGSPRAGAAWRDASGSPRAGAAWRDASGSPRAGAAWRDASGSPWRAGGTGDHGGAAGRIVAVEANISCPNVEDRRNMFAHSCEGVAAAVGAAVEGLAGTLPLWVKLSPNVTDLPALARSAVEAGAGALVLTNTLMALALDPATGRPRLGAGGGGLSGPALHSVAVRAVYECRAALPEVPIIGVGGIMSGEDAAEFLAAGADAVQVGTATFADPHAPLVVLEQLRAWCSAYGIRTLAELTGRSHRSAAPADGGLTTAAQQAQIPSRLSVPRARKWP